MVWIRQREAKARPGSVGRAGELIPILREIRSHWKALRRKVAVSCLHFDKTTLAATWRMECGTPRGWNSQEVIVRPRKEVRIA